MKKPTGPGLLKKTDKAKPAATKKTEHNPPPKAKVKGNPVVIPGPEDPLFQMPIRVLLITGEIGVGKTTFAYNLNPNDDTTVVFDLEMSGVNYAEQRPGIHYINVLEEMAEAYPRGYTLPDLWSWFVAKFNRVCSSGKYKLAVIDPGSEIEDAFEASIRKNPNKYGITENQLKNSPALLWGVMKSAWKRELAMGASKLDCLAMIVHMRQKFVGNTPSSVKEAKGKSVLRELATLFVELYRKPGADRKGPPRGKILKSRLSLFRERDGMKEPIPILPDVLPKADAYALRWYMANPIDDRVMSKDEIADVESERMKLAELDAINNQSRLDAARQEAENLKVASNLEEARKARREAAEEKNDSIDDGKPAIEEVAANETEPAAPESEPAIKKDDPPGMRNAKDPCDDALRSHLLKAKSRALNEGMSEKGWKDSLAKRGAKKIAELTLFDGESMLQLLSKKLGDESLWDGYVLARREQGLSTVIDSIPF